jgi:hypothetical protein
MRVLILFFLTATFAAGNAYGQGEAGSAQPRPQPREPERRQSRGTPANAKAKKAAGDRDSLSPSLYAAAEDIQTMRPGISRDILYQDVDAIRESSLSVRRIYSQRGFSSSDADSALLYGWTQLRGKLLEPTAALSTESLISYVSGFGKLIIKSTPPGALVELDGSALSDKTAAVAWPSAGTYRIKISMDNHETIEDTCTVEEGKPTIFERTLKPLKKKPEKSPRKLKPQ